MKKFMFLAMFVLGGCSSEHTKECTRPNPSQDCRTLGCEANESCVVEPGACLASSCSCRDGEWECTADCGEKYQCVRSDVCEGPDPSVDCQKTGCDEGFECVQEVEFTTCLPSTCSCTEGSWVCTDDCGQRHECLAAD